MKKVILMLVVVVVSSLYSCTEDRFVGSGDTISEFRNVELFDKVSSEGTFEVIITKGNEQSVELIADDNIMSRVKTDVVNGHLKLKLSDGNYNNVHLEAHITVLDLKEVRNSGTGDLMAYNIDYEGTFKTFNSGSANIYLDGSCTSLNIQNEGSGSVLAFDLLSENCNVDNVGSGEVEVTCESNLDVDIEGSGNVFYKGYPIINVSIQGSGSLVDRN